jgi:predicted CopG family antitoxin
VDADAKSLMPSKTVSAKVPDEVYTLLQTAKQATGAVSISDLVRDAIRNYLATISLSEELVKRAKEGLREVGTS